MDPIQSRAIGAALFFVFLFLSGFWVTLSGKPYSVIRFNVHKFIGLATVAFLGLTVHQTHQAAPLGATEIVATVVTFFALCRQHRCRQPGEHRQAHAGVCIDGA